MSRIRFLNTYIDNITMDEAIKSSELLIKKNVQSYIVTPNLDHIVTLETDDELKNIYQDASLILTDGQPMLWISKLIGTPIIEKISGSDFFPRICKLAACNGYSIFILGAAEGIAEKAAKKLCEKYNGLIVVGTYSPEYGFEKEKNKVEKILNIIRNAKPDILAVALGAPKGEKFIYRYKNDLDVPLAMQIGATIDFEAGNVKRAPSWMSKYGMEWIYRTLQDPTRLAKRYLNDALRIGPIIYKYRNSK